jgi:hypothetical protein
LLLLPLSAFPLAAGPLWAQQSQDSASTQAASEGQNAGQQQTSPQAAGSEAAKSQAEKVGMRNVEDVKGTNVLKGTSATDIVVYMIVGPAGELLALAAPLPGPLGSPAASDARAGSTSSESGTEGQSTSSNAPQAGEPAESGYMATPNMWDPATVESGMRQLELGTRSVAGEIPKD